MPDSIERQTAVTVLRRTEPSRLERGLRIHSPGDTGQTGSRPIISIPPPQTNRVHGQIGKQEHVPIPTVPLRKTTCFVGFRGKAQPNGKENAKSTCPKQKERDGRVRISMDRGPWVIACASSRPWNLQGWNIGVLEPESAKIHHPSSIPAVDDQGISTWLTCSG